ncbi:MAG TPA: VOC family protein [Solirubrobacterales bacterium]|nr:VOC family protein [Solirubrobacterales bacterium]
MTLEVSAEEITREAAFWELLGFSRAEPPADLAPGFAWLQRGGTQIHLMSCDSPSVPRHGHVAVVVPELEETVERLREKGIEVGAKRERWGSPRAQARTPAGHLVELMRSPPS